MHRTTLRVKRFLPAELSTRNCREEYCITSARACVCVRVSTHFVFFCRLNAFTVFVDVGVAPSLCPLPPRVFNRLWTKAYFMSDSKIARIQDRMNKGLEVKEKAGFCVLFVLLHRLAHTAQLLRGNHACFVTAVVE